MEWTANRIFLVFVSILSILIIASRLTRTSAVMILATAIIGYGITRDVLFSVAIACLMGNIYVSMLYQYQVPYMETFANKNQKKKKTTKSKTKPTEDDNEDLDTIVADTEGEEFFIDKKESFLDTVKSLDPDQLKGLNKDTKALIDTQKQLIETLNQMGPALKDGKNILDTFKNYFGSDDMKKLMPM
jgi:hypothetical protein